MVSNLVELQILLGPSLCTTQQPDYAVDARFGFFALGAFGFRLGQLAYNISSHPHSGEAVYAEPGPKSLDDVS